MDLDRLFHEAETAAPGPRPLGTISTGLGRLRELVASAAYLSKWRGTAKGLHRFLQTATGEREFEIKENVDSTGRPKPFHIAVTAPASLTPHRTLLERIIESEKPAYVTYELVFSTKN